MAPRSTSRHTSGGSTPVVHAFDVLGPSPACHVRRCIAPDENTRAFTRNTPSCVRLPVPHTTTGVVNRDAKMTGCPDVFGSYAPVAVDRTPANPVRQLSA